MKKPQKKQQKKPRRGMGCLFRLILILAALGTAVYLLSGWLPLMFMDGSGEGLSVNGDLPSSWYNALLLGEDEPDGGQYGRTDTMIVASVNRRTGQVKLTSLLRDMLVEIPGHGKNKINTAYRFGGPELAMETVNRNFGLNITKYVAVSFDTFPYLVEAVGGVRLTVTEEELPQLNRLVLSMRHRFKNTGLDTRELAAAGENVRLTGLQATAYARIRSIDSDFMRTSRQRRVIGAILDKVRGTVNPIRLFKCARVAFKHVKTNLNGYQISALGLKLLAGSGEMEQIRIPAEGAYTSGTENGQWSIRPDMKKNRAMIYEFIYGQ